MDIGTLVNLVVYLIVVGCILGLLLYLVAISPIPEPWKGWLHWLIIVCAVLIIIYFLLGLISGGGVPKLRVGHTDAGTFQQVLIPAPRQQILR